MKQNKNLVFPFFLFGSNKIKKLVINKISQLISFNFNVFYRTLFSILKNIKGLMIFYFFHYIVTFTGPKYVCTPNFNKIH